MQYSIQGLNCDDMERKDLLMDIGTEELSHLDKSEIAADLALIAAAQKVEHYEISAYGTSRAMAGQAGYPEVAALLSKSLAEEEVADSLLTQIARELMGASRGLPKEPPVLAGAGETSKKPSAGRPRRNK